MAPTNESAKPMKTFTLDELRGILSENIDQLRSGTTNPANANALCNTVGKILSSVKLEMEYHRLTGRKLDIPNLITHTESDPTKNAPEVGEPAPKGLSK